MNMYITIIAVIRPPIQPPVPEVVRSLIHYHRFDTLHVLYAQVTSNCSMLYLTGAERQALLNTPVQVVCTVARAAASAASSARLYSLRASLTVSVWLPEMPLQFARQT